MFLYLPRPTEFTECQLAGCVGMAWDKIQGWLLCPSPNLPGATGYNQHLRSVESEFSRNETAA